MKWWDRMPWSSFSECWALSQLFPLSTFTFIKRLFSPSSRSAIRVRQGEKTTLRMGEKIANETTDKGLISKTHNQLICIIYKMYNSTPEKQTTHQKMEKRSKQTFLQRWLTNTWKDAQHRSLLEKCKSKLQWDITSHKSEWPSSKSLQTINTGEGVEKRTGSCTVGGD